MESSEKLKISSSLIFPKLIIIGILGALFLLMTDHPRTDANILAGYLVIFILLSLLLYGLFTRPDIYYDPVQFYIIKGKKLNIEIPLENIQAIKFSAIGLGNAGYSYKIKYLDNKRAIQTIRVFPEILSNSFSKFIACAKEKNPEVKISNWSIGINELFD